MDGIFNGWKSSADVAEKKKGGAKRGTIYQIVREVPQLRIEPYNFFNRIGNMGRVGMAWVGPPWYMAAKQAFAQLNPVLTKIRAIPAAIQDHLHVPSFSNVSGEG